MESPDRLRIAYLAYRGNPHSGGQGVYTRYLTRELVGLGHQVAGFVLRNARCYLPTTPPASSRGASRKQPQEKGTP